MQRLYSMFPDRGPGVGLLLLRVALGLMLLVDPMGRLLPADGTLFMRIAWGAAVMLLCGWLTPLALVLAIAVTLPRSAEPIALLLMVMLGAMCLLGPGAYSLDACLFGRRVLRRGGHRPPPED